MQNGLGKAGRLELPWALFAYPFYLWKRSPGKEGSHYDPECDLFTKQERNMVRVTSRVGAGELSAGGQGGGAYVGQPWVPNQCLHTVHNNISVFHPQNTRVYYLASVQTQVLTSDAFMIGMVGILAACTYALGPWMMFKLYMVPYWINVVWLDIVTYLHHHGSSDPNEKVLRLCLLVVYVQRTHQGCFACNA